MYPKKAKKNIRYLTKYDYPQVYPNIPICFGNLLTPKYVLTAVTCFIDEKGWKKILKTKKNLKEKLLSGDFLRAGIEEFIFVMVSQIFDI